ncbi:hypothetical protein CMK19_01105, partial [Candidatus Poribacteria bacterium]|nr:hypothetical protein [Candidatus Poribacteria bacterium]
MLTKHDILSSLLNTTFGNAGSPTGTRSITATFEGDTLILKYQSIVHFAGEHAVRGQMSRIAEEAIQVLTDKVSELKSSYKDVTGDALKLKEVFQDDDVEILPGAIHAPRRTAYY